MLSSFTKAYFFHYMVGSLFILVCWLPTFFIPQEVVVSEIFSSDAIIKTGFSNIFILNILALVVTMVSALVLNYIVTEFGITGKLMTLGIFFFSFLSVSVSTFTVMNPFILINFFLFFFIRNLFRLPDEENPIPIIFNASLMLSIASLYFLKIILLFIIIWVALMIHRASSWRNYVTSIIGLIIPYIFILAWYFWSDQLNDFLLDFSTNVSIQFNALMSFRTNDLVISILISILLLIAVLKTLARLNEKNINLRRNLIISIYYLLASFAIFILFAPGTEAALIIVIPAGIIMSNAFHDIRNFRWYNLLFGVLLVLIMINQYLKFFF